MKAKLTRVLIPVVLWTMAAAAADLPSAYDLRDVDGQSYVTAVKSQQGGTCWTFGAMAAVEGNLMMTGAWSAAGEIWEPDLAEYHLDWWNGFNQHNNDDTDPPTGGGLTVHQGGDYRVTAAYLTRGEGAVRDVDGQSFSTPPARSLPGYHYYYVRDIEWYTAGTGLERIHLIQQAVMTHGVVGTCMCYNSGFLSGTVHYQPPTSTWEPNHAVAIIGWDDEKTTQAPAPGAWLCKNSWGAGWGEEGFFWISYYDKHCGQHPEMGAISFQGVEPMRYAYVYYHDYHGWRDTLAGVTDAFNAFVAGGHEMIEAVSFYTAAEDVEYTAVIYDRFEDGVLLDALATLSGTLAYSGFHTLDLAQPVGIDPGDDFYVYVALSAGGHPFDRSSEIPVLLGASGRVWVESASAPGQSLYYSAGAWRDLHNDNDTANFCIKALTSDYRAVRIACQPDPPRFIPPGQWTPLRFRITDAAEGVVPGSPTLHFRIAGGEFEAYPLEPIGEDRYEAALPPVPCGSVPEFYVSVLGDLGTAEYDPPDAPAELHAPEVGTLQMNFEDDFETDKGWTVTSWSLQHGEWERGVPATGGERGTPEFDYDGSGSCYVTENVPGQDVDGGPTRLTSPVLDLSGESLLQRVTYARWFYNDNKDEDRLDVQISNDGGSSWELVESVPDFEEGWIVRTFEVGDFVAPTQQVVVRFETADDPNNSITEAGVDAFAVQVVACMTVAGDMNCDGGVDFRDINPFILAVTGWEAYHVAQPECNWFHADCNDSGTVDFRDINPFVLLLGE